MERVRYDLLLVINTLTLAVICNSAVWAVLLCVSAHQHRVPFLGIQPSNVPLSGSLKQIIYQQSRMRQRPRHRRHTTVAQGMYQGACLVHARAQQV